MRAYRKIEEGFITSWQFGVGQKRTLLNFSVSKGTDDDPTLGITLNFSKTFPIFIGLCLIFRQVFIDFFGESDQF
ncbi:MAG: hypothetical protein ACOCQD_02535 [archaeon]